MVYRQRIRPATTAPARAIIQLAIPTALARPAKAVYNFNALQSVRSLPQKNSATVPGPV